MSKKLYLLFLIPLLPMIFNYILPLGNFSKIGGDDSLVVWLNFWATFSNTLIYSAITIFVLYKQIQNNSVENKLNRQQLKYQILQSQYLILASESERFIKFFDGSVTTKIFMSWLNGSKAHLDCQREVLEIKSEFLSSWFKLSQLIPIQDKGFLKQQEANMRKLYQLFDFYVDIFQVKGTGVLWIEKLSRKEYDDCFNYLQKRFPKIRILHDIVFEHIDYIKGYSDITHFRVVEQFNDYLDNKREKLIQYDI